MKYFTREIWAGWQGGEKELGRAMRDWKRNRTRYQISLRKLAPRLGRHGKFFTDHSLHDGRLVAFTISDCNLKRNPKRVKSETVVRIDVLAWNEKKLIYELSYRGIQEIVVRTKNDLFPLDVSLFGDWGYDEVLPVGRNYFQHNILFQTGTEMSVTFREFAFRVKRG